MPRLISTLHATVLGLALPCLAISHEGATHDTADASPRPDAHAPIGVMAEHTHSAGEFMLSYRFAVMNMAGIQLLPVPVGKAINGLPDFCLKYS